MVNLTTVDAAIVKKINASKAKFMTGPQLETALPTLAAKDIRASVQFMVVNQVLVTTTNRAGDVAFKVKTDPTGGGSAAKLDTRLLPVDQKFVYGAIQSAQGKGINLRNLKAVLAGKNITIPPMVMKKLLQGLEKQGFIKSFTAINAPTVPLYHGYQFEPDPTLIGGFFYNPQTKSLDTDLINRLTTVCLSMVRTRTLPLTAAHYDAMRSSSKSAPAPDSDDPPNYPLIPVMKRNPPSPAEILAFVRKHSIVPNCDLGAIMQVMRAIEMEGLVERIKPIGGVSPVEGISSDEDEPGPSKRRKMKKGDDSDSDDSGEERKAREKAKMKKKKEKERERAKEKEREKKRKEKEREKEKEKKRKEREKEKKAKRKKEKEREKKKRKRDDTPDSGDDSDALRAIDDSPDGKKSKSKSKSKSSSSKSKKSKRKRGASSDSSSGSDSDSGSATASSSDTDSDSDSGSGSGSESDASSVNSEDIDNDDLALHRGGASGGADGEDDDGGPVGIKNLSDSHVAYRAVRPYSFGFGFGEMPCGKCPVFSFCQEGGPVNATECVYIEDWLTGNRGGWTNEAELREQKELKERTQRAEAEAREAAKAKKAERERLKKLGERVEEEGMVEDDDHDGMASGREDADEGWDD